MTVIANDRRKEYPGNGVTVDFDGPRALSADHLSLYLVDDATGAAAVQTSGFTLTGIGADSTHYVMDTPPASGFTVLILRTVPYSQECDISNQGAYLPEVLEGSGLDPLAMQIQQVADTAERSLHLADTVVGFSAVIENPVALAPIIVNATRDGIGMGDPNMTGDMLLRPNLADGVTVGLGAKLVAWTQAGAGAIVRWLLDKVRENVTPEDFGAIGDGTDRPVSQWLSGGLQDRGYANLAAIQAIYPHVANLTDSLDWAGFQQAINSCKASGRVLRCSGNYMMNRGLVIDVPIRLEGGGAFMQGAVTTPTYVAGARITATAAVATMIYVSPANNPDAIHYATIRGLLLDGNNLALKCLIADSCTRCTFEDLEGRRCTTVGFDFTDAKGYYFYKNFINRINYNATASVAAQNSDGVWFRDTVAAAGGCVQNVVGWITTNTVNGNGITVGGADNNDFGSVIGFVSGTGVGLLFKGPTGFGTLPPRNNFIRYTGGSIVDQTNTRSNYIQFLSSESGSITLSGSGGEVKFRAFNYSTGQWWSTPEYTMKDVAVYPCGSLGLQGATAGILSSIWDCVDFADGATQGVALSTMMPYSWHSGNIKTITLCLAMSTAVAGNLRIRVRISTPADATGTGTASTDESFTITPSTSSGVAKDNAMTLSVPQSVTKGDVILIRIDRVGADGADTHTGVMKLMSVAVHYTATGPSSDGGGGGPHQVLDPVI